MKQAMTSLRIMIIKNKNNKEPGDLTEASVKRKKAKKIMSQRKGPFLDFLKRSTLDRSMS